MTKPGPQQLRAKELREQKLKEIREQIASGRITVRQMTAEERKAHPKPVPRPDNKRKRHQRGRG